MQNKQKISAYLGFAIKAGKVIWGVDEITKKPRRRPLILMCASAGADTTKQIEQYVAKTQSYLLVLTDFSLEDILNKNCKVVAITEQNLAKAIIANADVTDCGGENNE